MVEEIQLAGSSHHVEIDDVSDIGGEMGIPGRQGVRQVRFPGQEPPVTEKGGRATCPKPREQRLKKCRRVSARSQGS